MNVIELRKAQKDLAAMVARGYHKELAKLHAAFFKEYLGQGFDRRESLQLVMTFFYGPEKGGKK